MIQIELVVPEIWPIKIKSRGARLFKQVHLFLLFSVKCHRSCVNILYVDTKPTTQSLPSPLRHQASHVPTLAPLLLRLAHLTMLFILQLTHTVSSDKLYCGLYKKA